MRAVWKGKQKVPGSNPGRGIFYFSCFDVPVTNIDPLGLPLKYFLGKDLHNPVIVAPDSTASDR